MKYFQIAALLWLYFTFGGNACNFVAKRYRLMIYVAKDSRHQANVVFSLLVCLYSIHLFLKGGNYRARRKPTV